MESARRAAVAILALALFWAGTLVCRADASLVATSSNPSILPESKIQIEWNGAAFAVTFVLSAEEGGSATVRFAITDGLTSAPLAPDFEDRAVEVEPPNSGSRSNAPPLISAVANQFIAAGAATVSLSLMVGDSESPPESLSVEAWASDTELIPRENITVGGSGEQRTLTVRRAPETSGATLIGVAVSDGELTTVESFVLSVAPSSPPDGQLRILSLRRMSVPGMIVTWTAVPGEIYQVLRKDKLEQWNWIPASPQIMAYGTTAAWIDPAVQDTSARFYQIRKIPAAGQAGVASPNK